MFDEELEGYEQNEADETCRGEAEEARWHAGNATRRAEQEEARHRAEQEEAQRLLFEEEACRHAEQEEAQRRMFEEACNAEARAAYNAAAQQPVVAGVGDMEGVDVYLPIRTMTAEERARYRAPKRKVISETRNEIQSMLRVEQDDAVLMEGQADVWASADNASEPDEFGNADDLPEYEDNEDAKDEDYEISDVEDLSDLDD